jgi:hypothetical protein
MLTDKLLAKAAEYEDRARSLRLAAAEMNGDAINGKRKTAASTLDAAIALRNGQRNGHGNGKYRPGQGKTGRMNIPIGEREETIRGALLAGPQPMPVIRAALDEHGQSVSSSWANKIMQAMKDVRQVGRGNKTVWALGKPKKRVSTRAAVHDTRVRIAEVLKRYDTKEPRDPGRLAKQMGLTVAQTALGPLLAQGYLKKRKGGYIRTTKRYVVDDAPPAAPASD